eukprot:Selendium_serpulae@DN3124_c0_g1_i1.p2
MWDNRAADDAAGEPKKPRAAPRRVNGAQLPRFVGCIVRVVGLVENTSLSTNSEGLLEIALNAPDGTAMRVVSSSRPQSKHVEVVAEVRPNLVLKAMEPLIEMGDDLNMTMFHNAIKLGHNEQMVQHFACD